MHVDHLQGASNKFKELLAHIPGFGHKLSKNDEVMIRGGNTKDLNGVLYKVIRNKKRHIEPEHTYRHVALSKWGILYEKNSFRMNGA